MEFPKMLYRAGVGAEVDGHACASLIVRNEAEEADALADGWAESFVPGAAESERERDDNAPPTRAELEAKAAELSIPYSPRVSDKKLSAAIAAKLAEV